MSDQLFEPMVCPVCGNFYFSELQEDDNPNKLYCHQCGWKYDIDQAKNPLLSIGANEMSVENYKKEYQEKLSLNPNYNYLDDNYSASEHQCPVCQKHIFKDVASFDVCPYCGWEDDGLMEKEPDKWAGTANDLCLNDYIKRYKKLIGIKPNYKYKNDSYL